MKTKIIEPRLEEDVQAAVATYLATNYPDVPFHSDFGSGTKLSKKQAAKQKRQNAGRTGWPDMFIAKPSVAVAKFGHKEQEIVARLGLFLELKVAGTRLKKKNGEWATGHIADQAKVLEVLRKEGYVAGFACGLAEAIRIIDNYLGGEDDKDICF